MALGTVKRVYLVLAMPVRTLGTVKWLYLVLAMLVTTEYLFSLCISFVGFKALGTVKCLYLVLAMPITPGYLFALTLYIIWRIHGLRNCKTALISISYTGKDWISLCNHFIYHLKYSWF